MHEAQEQRKLNGYLRLLIQILEINIVIIGQNFGWSFIDCCTIPEIICYFLNFFNLFLHWQGFV